MFNEDLIQLSQQVSWDPTYLAFQKWIWKAEELINFYHFKIQHSDAYFKIIRQQMGQFRKLTKTINYDQNFSKGFTFNLDEMLQPWIETYGEEAVQEYFQHFTAVKNLPDMAKEYIQAEAIQNFVSWFVVEIWQSPQVLEADLDSRFKDPEYIKYIEKVWRPLPENWPSVYLQAFKKFGQYVANVRFCPTICDHKFYNLE